MFSITLINKFIIHENEYVYNLHLCPSGFTRNKKSFVSFVFAIYSHPPDYQGISTDHLFLCHPHPRPILYAFIFQNTSTFNSIVNGFLIVHALKRVNQIFAKYKLNC